nr:MAG TPA_asm: hypothetical protein [Caudoviricetes sp.]
MPHTGSRATAQNILRNCAGGAYGHPARVTASYARSPAAWCAAEI